MPKAKRLPFIFSDDCFPINEEYFDVIAEVDVSMSRKGLAVDIQKVELWGTKLDITKLPIYARQMITEAAAKAAYEACND
jgi:hypothetical protein